MLNRGQCDHVFGTCKCILYEAKVTRNNFTHSLGFGELSLSRRYPEFLLQSSYNRPERLCFGQMAARTDMSDLHCYHTDSTAVPNLNSTTFPQECMSNN